MWDLHEGVGVLEEEEKEKGREGILCSVFPGPSQKPTERGS